MIRVRVVTGMHSGVFSNVLLDSGSGMSLVSIQFVQKLGLRSQPLQPGDNTHCIAANSEFVPITSKVRLQMQIGGLTVYEWVYCIKNLSHNVILGLRFMRNNRVNLLNDIGMVKIRGVQIPFVSGSDYLSLAVAKFDTVIPPRSTTTLSFKANAVKKGVPFKIVSLPTPFRGLAVEAMPTMNNGNLCAVSRNNSDFPMRLKRNTPFGYAVRVDNVQGSRNIPTPRSFRPVYSTDAEVSHRSNAIPIVRDQESSPSVTNIVRSNVPGGLGHQGPILNPSAPVFRPADSGHLPVVQHRSSLGDETACKQPFASSVSSRQDSHVAQADSVSGSCTTNVSSGPVAPCAASPLQVTTSRAGAGADTAFKGSVGLQTGVPPGRTFQQLGLKMDGCELSENDQKRFVQLSGKVSMMFLPLTIQRSLGVP